ncbi:hypothetical protein JD969_10350 [Planctomycetota bacterium]|nr:hypothetical protein JD969_10350 [Planctomycetota bacterium]
MNASVKTGLMCVLAGVLGLAELNAEEAKPMLKDFVGINGHTILFDSSDYSSIAKLGRDYHGINWDLGDETNNALNFPWADNGVNWDNVYGNWEAGGVSVHASLMLHKFPEASDWANVEADAKAYGRAFAQHFGPSAGNGLVKTVEIGNEPHEMSSALYRRVFRSMAEGIKEVDPQVKIATCAVAVNPTSEYIKNISIYNDMLDLVDIFSVHTYSRLEGWPTWEQSYPEDTQATYFEVVEDVINWRNSFAEGKEVWVTEFGYDASTKNPSDSGQFKNWVDVTDRQQAQYLVRSYAAFAKLDVERAYMYWFDDKDRPELYGSSGITRNGVPKESYWALEQMQTLLGDYRFDEVIREDNVYVYSFVNGENENDEIWVVWSPTGDNVEFDFVLEGLEGEVEWVKEMAINSWDDWTGDFELLGDDMMSLRIGESPTYIKINNLPEPSTLMIVSGLVLVMCRRR